MNQVRYTPEIADAILNRMAEGESLRQICKDPAMPSISAVMAWVAEDKEGFQAKYSLAMDNRAQGMFDEMLEIADNVGHEDKDTIEFEKGGVPIQIPNKEWVMRSKLRVEARQWALARMAPKRYGNKVTQEISGPDGKPISVNSQAEMRSFETVKDLVDQLRDKVQNPEERAKLIASLPGQLGQDAHAVDRIATCRAALIAERLDKGMDAASTVQPPASFRGQNNDDQ